MSLPVLAALVVIGVGMIVAAIHFTGGSRGASLDTPSINSLMMRPPTRETTKPRTMPKTPIQKIWSFTKSNCAVWAGFRQSRVPNRRLARDSCCPQK